MKLPTARSKVAHDSGLRSSKPLVVAVLLLGVQLASFTLSSIAIFADYPPPWLVYQPGIGVLLLTPLLWVVCCGIVYLFWRRHRLSLRMSIFCGIALALEPIVTILCLILIPAGAGPFD